MYLPSLKIGVVVGYSLHSNAKALDLDEAYLDTNLSKVNNAMYVMRYCIYFT